MFPPMEQAIKIKQKRDNCPMVFYATIAPMDMSCHNSYYCHPQCLQLGKSINLLSPASSIELPVSLKFVTGEKDYWPVPT